jgi:hypothetical protein
MVKFLSLGAAGIVVMLAVFFYGQSQYNSGYSKSAIACKQAAIDAKEKSLEQKDKSREKFRSNTHRELVKYLSDNDGLRSNE